MTSHDRPRNVPVDVARAASILVVVWFHLSFFQVAAVDVGRLLPHLTLTMRSVGPGGWAGSWFMQIMPLFFVAGGFANTLVVDRLVRQGHGYGNYLARRGGRLVGPLVLYLGVATLIGTSLAWVATPRAGAQMTLLATNVLWFVSVYLVIVLIAPAMVVAHDRWGAGVPALLLAGALVVDAASFATGELEIREINLLLVWPFAHQLGIAYARGWLRHQPPWRSWATLAGAALAILVLLGIAPYPTSAVGVGDQMVSNLAPPTTPLALLALAQCAVLALVEHHAGGRLRAAHRLQKAVADANALAMTIYLWHLPVIAMTVGLLLLAPAVAGQPVDLLLHTPFFWLLGIPLIVLLVPLIARAERSLMPPTGDRTSALMCFSGMLVLMIGLELIRNHGMALHPATLLAAAGPALFALGALLLARGSNLPDPATDHDARSRSTGTTNP